MLTRRHFIRDTASTMAGMVVVGGGVGGATTTGVPPASTGERRQVVVGGRRVKTVDVHSHCEIPGIREMMGGTPSANRALTIGPDRLREMDARGIDVEVLSINPFWYAVDRDLALRLVRAQNERLADVCAAYPDRFVGLATVALQHPELAAEQLEEGVKTLGLRGGSVGASVGSEALRHLVAEYGASQIMIGTDYPFPWTATPGDARVPRFLAVNHVLGTPGLSDADRVAILGGNAATLFNIPV